MFARMGPWLWDGDSHKTTGLLRGPSLFGFLAVFSPSDLDELAGRFKPLIFGVGLLDNQSVSLFARVRKYSSVEMFNGLN